jgi:hypothetical protein
MDRMGSIEPGEGVSKPGGPTGPGGPEGLGGIGGQFDLKMGEEVGSGGMQHLISANDYAAEYFLRDDQTSWEEKGGTWYTVSAQKDGSNAEWISISTYTEDSKGNKIPIPNGNFPNAYYVTMQEKTPDPYHTRYELFTGPNKIPAPYLNFDKLVSIPNNMADMNKYLPGFHKQLLMQLCMQIMNELKKAQQSYKESLQGEGS